MRPGLGGRPPSGFGSASMEGLAAFPKGWQAPLDREQEVQRPCPVKRPVLTARRASPTVLGVALADDVVREWPQMSEIVRGRKLIGAIEGQFEEPTLAVGERRRFGDFLMVEWSNDYGDDVIYRNLTIAEMRREGRAGSPSIGESPSRCLNGGGARPRGWTCRRRRWPSAEEPRTTDRSPLLRRASRSFGRFRPGRPAMRKGADRSRGRRPIRVSLRLRRATPAPPRPRARARASAASRASSAGTSCGRRGASSTPAAGRRGRSSRRSTRRPPARLPSA